MRVAILCALVAALAAPSFGGRFSCYLGTWATYLPGDGQFNIEDVPGDLCTHAIYSFVGLNEGTNQIQILDSGLDIDDNGYGRFTGLKNKYPGLKTLLSVGGWSEGGEKYSNMVSDSGRRAAFVRSAVDFLNKYGFDGLDVDWEYPGVEYRGGKPSDKGNFVSLLRELREAFNQQGRGWELSIAVSPEQSVIDVGYDVAAICQQVDVVNLMTYDLHGSWDNIALPHSPLYDSTGIDTANGVENWLRGGCAASKLIVGLPFYGKSYNTGDGNNNHEVGTSIVGDGDAGPITQSAGMLAYYEICDFVNNRGWTERYDDSRQAPFAFQGHNWVGYDNARSVQAKVDYVRSKGLGGVMTWSIDTDDFRGKCGQKFPLATAARGAV